jgi:transposase
VALMLLWQEYRAGQPEGYGYSRFCDLYAEWRGGVSLTMRQTHVAGAKLFVDFAGQTLAVVDPATGQVRPAQVFVAVLGASSRSCPWPWCSSIDPRLCRGQAATPGRLTRGASLITARLSRFM